METNERAVKFLPPLASSVYVDVEQGIRGRDGGGGPAVLVVVLGRGETEKTFSAEFSDPNP